MFRQILSELLWLLTSLVLTLFALLIFTGDFFPLFGLNFHAHDAMVVVSAEMLTLTLFLLVNFIIYFIWINYHSYKKTVSNWIFTITGILLILNISLLGQLNLSTGVGQWNLNSTIGWGPNPDLPQPITFDPLSTVLICLQITLLGLLVFGAFKWGRCRSKD